MSTNRDTGEPSHLPNRCNVVVVTYNSAATLDDLFAGLVANSAEIDQVTLVDNGSTDDTLGLARRLSNKCKLDVQIIPSHNTGFAGGHWAARNSFARTDLPTLCVNPDLRLAADTARTMIRAMQSPFLAAPGIITAPLVNTDGEEDTASRRQLPTFLKGAAYSVFGKLLPARLRYNSRSDGLGVYLDGAGVRVLPIEATTGALMLVNPRFRSIETGIFDRDYFMYGEDLQLCLDAKRQGWAVYMVDTQPSVHLKGVSSGWPRSWKSNRAFHHAMYLYYAKNLSKGTFDRILVRAIVGLRLTISGGVAIAARYRR